jgi:hypothetical protein
MFYFSLLFERKGIFYVTMQIQLLDELYNYSHER